MPTRLVREGLLDSDKINQLTPEEEGFFFRLILCVDDFGRFDGRPVVIKNRAYPLKDTLTVKKVENYMLKCVKVGLVSHYQIKGKAYIEILEFNQRLRAKKSKYPENDGHVTGMCQASACNNLQDVGREEKRREVELHETEFTFDEFWKIYSKSVDKAKCLQKYSSIKEPERKIIKATITAYIKHHSEIKFRKNPLTYLNGQCWNDEIPVESKRGVYRE